MQFLMSPTAGMPSSSRSTPDDPPSSATVTMAVRLLVCSLRPRNRVDKPVPPPMATILGPRARKRFWLDELDQRLVGVGRAERIGQDPDGPVGPEADQHDSDAAGDEPAHREGQELERQEVDETAGEAARCVVPGDLAEEMRERDREQQESRKDARGASA